MPLTKQQLLIPRVMCVYKVYVLIDPTDNIIKYVGMTKNNLDKRLTLHCNNTPINKERNPEKFEWVMGLRKIGLKPIIQLVDSFSSELEAISNEKKLTDSFFESGVPIYNKYSGRSMSESAKIKASIKRIGKPLPRSVTIASIEKRKKSVIQLTKGMQFVKRWEFIIDASRALNIDRGDITKRCKNGNTIGGFKWMYEADYQEYQKQKQ